MPVGLIKYELKNKIDKQVLLMFTFNPPALTSFSLFTGILKIPDLFLGKRRKPSYRTFLLTADVIVNKINKI